MTSPLYERQATGGVVARDGFGYQDAYLLQHLPLLLSQSAFSHAASEVLGDIEVRYYRPGGGTYCVLYEAKRNQLTKTDLWQEVAHFHELHTAAPTEYVRFVLVCGDFVNELLPLLRKLERLRGPAASLNEDSTVRASAEAEIVSTIVSLGQTAEIGQFVLEHVEFSKYDDSQVEGGFSNLLSQCFPVLNNLRNSETQALLKECKQLVAASMKGGINRKTLEDILTRVAASSTVEWLTVPTGINLLAGSKDDFRNLPLDVGRFNGPDRGQLGAKAWANLLSETEELGAFLLASRSRRSVRLSAKQRMSLACMLGFCFSATRNFVLQMEHNGTIFDTSLHDRDESVFFNQRVDFTKGDGVDGVVCISFPISGEKDVLTACELFGLSQAPKVFLTSTRPLTDLAALNTAVNETKAALVDFRSRNRLKKLHLFIKAPSVFAMGLGHRLNGLGPVQLYDWIDIGYQPTALLG